MHLQAAHRNQEAHQDKNHEGHERGRRSDLCMQVAYTEWGKKAWQLDVMSLSGALLTAALGARAIRSNRVSLHTARTQGACARLIALGGSI